jgi:hypothetical protein
MSFSLVLNTQKGVYNTTGTDCSWAYDFSMSDEGPYEVSSCFYSKNVALTSYTTQLPNLCIDIGQSTSIREASSTNGQNFSKVIGVLRLVWNSATIGAFQSDVTSNPHFFLPNLGRNSNVIRMYIVQAGTNTLITTSLIDWSSILYFKKVRPERSLTYKHDE